MVRFFPTTLIRLLTMLLMLNIGVASADDIDIYVPDVCTSDEAYRFIFIVDNSGSMSLEEFNQSKATVDATISSVIDSLNHVEVAVVQYGSNEAGEHDYHVTIPFTIDKPTALNWQRAFGAGGNYKPDFIQDHQPASLAKMRNDDVYAPGGALDITDGTNVQFVFFTDAERDVSQVGCCSSIVADSTTFADPTDVLPMFGEYNALKDGSVLPGNIEAQFTLLHIASDDQTRNAGAAIASMGGDYSGTIENDPDDPDGGGQGPRRYVEGTLTESDTTKILALIDLVVEEIKFTSEIESFSELSLDLNKSSWSTDNRVFLSLFKPSINRSWEGNFKGYFLGTDGLIDSNGSAATMQSDIGTIFADTAQSFWSSQPDGNQTTEGGARENLPATRTLYSNIDEDSALFVSNNVLSSSNVVITTGMLGVASEAERQTALDWTLTAPIGDPLHSKSEIVRYTDRTLIFGMTNHGFLHAIDATTPVAINNHTGGEEIWAFMPKELLPNLPLLASNSIVGDHIYGLDGHITRWHDDANNDGIVNQSDSMMLILGMRRGGQSYYALDITDPDYPTLSWRIQGGVTSGFDDLAQTWSKMSLIRVEYSGKSATNYTDANTDRVLVFGGGYDGDVLDDQTSRKTAQGGAIYMIAKDGSLLWKSDALMNYAIPSNLSVIDSDGDYLADRIYAPDLGGQIWRVDFDDVSVSSEFTVTLLAQLGESSFQPFFYAPSITLNGYSPDVEMSISIGSGNRDNPLDTTSNNRLYRVRDLHADKGPPPASFNVIKEGDLYDVTDYKLGSSDADTRSNAADALSAAKGWLLNLGGGEKALSRVINFEGTLVATTYAPATPSDDTQQACGSSTLSNSRIYIVDGLTGSPVSNDFSNIPNTTTVLNANHRHEALDKTGIPTTPVIVFPENSGETQLVVNKSPVATIVQNLQTVWWYGQ